MESVTETNQWDLSAAWKRAILVTLLGLFWTSWFWMQPTRSWPVWGDAYRAYDEWMRDWFNLSARYWRWVVKSYLFVGIPILILWFCGLPPRALGLGRMAQNGWRIVALSFVIALPFLVWLGLRPGMHRYYAHIFDVEGWHAVVANALVIAVEHAMIEGVILVLALPPGVFRDLDDPPRRGRLAFLGLGFPIGGPRTLYAWLGVPKHVFPALIGQALVFGAVHWGKDFGEFVTAFPGGFGLGLLTFRIRSVWPSVLLHLGTGSVVLLTIWLSRTTAG